MKLHLDREYETENYDPSVRAAFEPLLYEGNAERTQKRDRYARQCFAFLLSGRHDAKAMFKRMAGDWSPPMQAVLIGFAMALDSVDRLTGSDDLALAERFLSILTNKVADHQEGRSCSSPA
ncbi:MAG: hypothetical protein ABF932_00765 [Gluconobacter potus]|uniref:Transcriptional regulator n=1 Tax=Gluconobacter potus TaxID=2724927 RepID=A0ABR9YLN6_9PROT|nr:MULTISPECIES: hypothetical protein [Gluconobacter]KXV11378.1 hypothetical protein AD932_13090 [Gluconobacter oxydans]MBF0864617.1 hypothetical protein [Gluconobacter sp. R71656]MBF0866989.1 hypothetical protein [Gluconobacter sp. R75628]MBF0873419.1 hypothetical protein [Gluconobacter sp. R75629]MBF0882665.1 hypothetical protein [Gluconobacter potus]